ncbi:von Willebrand factor type A domain-containing protein [Triangularia setosa]|uniref:von Willebrand factor type A domain-containing protein n=1 Tax=Triangularia setosa TaxID=2587417 RepID=A0AAN6W0H6_9PEZI|nr:von Willebrand factor type A domain-containing protein [Podospora setosa]
MSLHVQMDAFHVSQDYRGTENNLALHTNSYLPHLTPVTFSGGAPSAPGAWAPPSLHPRLATYTVQEPSLGRNVLPPTSISIEASVIQDTASITVTQLFWNDSDRIIKEAAYTFPLSSGCTVTDFHCRIGHSRALAGSIKPKEEAHEEFEQHISKHATGAALLEQDTKEVFTTSLGNLPVRTRIRITLTYITILKHHFADRKGTTTLTVPTCIASRYGDKPHDYNDAASTNISKGLTLQIEVVEANKMVSITSPTHKVVVENQLGTRTTSSFADLAGQDSQSSVETALVKLEWGSTFLDRDFVLDIMTGSPSEEAELPQAWIERHPTVPNQQALMLTIPPGFTTRASDPSSKTEILFLADLSGSMTDKISSLRAAMQFFLKGIPQGRKFNIWCFGSSYKSWQPSSVEYGETSYLSAVSWAEANFHANMGGTELLPAVKAIVTARDKRLPTDVIVLTDGETWRLDETLECIRKQRDLTEGRVRFFALGIGKAVSHALVEGIARAGGGYSEVVREASEGDWEDRVVSMTEAALMTDHLGPMHLEVNILGGDGRSQASSIYNAERSPADISTLSPFNRNRIYFLFDSFKSSESIASITLTANTDRGTKSLDIPVTTPKRTNTTIHRLAARSMLEDLEQGQSHIHLGPSRPYPGSWDERNWVRKEAERIACKWSLVSKWTSFFLKEEPYHPEAVDAWFAEGVVKVEDEPGDDLLQSRGPIADVAMLEASVPPGSSPSSVLVGQLVSLPETFTWTAPPPLSQFSTLASRDSYYRRAVARVDVRSAGRSQYCEVSPHYIRPPSGEFDSYVHRLKMGAGPSGEWLMQNSKEPAMRRLSRSMSHPNPATLCDAKLTDSSSDGVRLSREEFTVSTQMALNSRVDQPRPQQLSPLSHVFSQQTSASPVPEAVLLEKLRPAKGKAKYFSQQNRKPTKATPPNNEGDRRWTENHVISELLRFQSAKGYFSRGYFLETDETDPFPSTTANSGEGDSEYLPLLCEFLGKEITNRLTLLRDKDKNDHLFGEDMALKERILFTIAICVLLKRDFASKRSLWILMCRKADGYLKEHIKRVDEAFAKVKAAVKGVRIEGYQSPEGPLVDADTYIYEPKVEIVELEVKDIGTRSIAEPEIAGMNQRVVVRIWSSTISQARSKATANLRDRTRRWCDLT